MAYLGDVGKVNPPLFEARQMSMPFFGARPLANTASGAGATANASLVFTYGNGIRQETLTADGSGNWSAHDYANGIYYAVELGTNKSWEVEIVANTPTVTALSSGGAGTVAFGCVF